VVKVDPAWKMNTAFASPPPFNVIGPVSCMELDARYTPGLSVRPPTVPPAIVVKGVSLAATPYAAVAEVCAASDVASAASVVPETVPGGNPVMEVPGERLISPLRTEFPVLVMVVPATTASGVAAPRLIAAAAKAGLLTKLTNVIALMMPIARTLMARRNPKRDARLYRTEMKRTEYSEFESGRIGAGVEPIRPHNSRVRIKFNLDEVENRFLCKKIYRRV
jgi:hypothetical protein